MIIKVNALEASAEIAEWIMRDKYGEKYDDLITKVGEERYTEQGQDIFNDIYDDIFSILTNLNEQQ